MDTSQVPNHWATIGTPIYNFDNPVSHFPVSHLWPSITWIPSPHYSILILCFISLHFFISLLIYSSTYSLKIFIKSIFYDMLMYCHAGWGAYIFSWCMMIQIWTIHWVASSWKWLEMVIKMVCTHTHSRILLGHEKEWNNAICSNMDGPRDYHTEGSKSDKDPCHIPLNVDSNKNDTKELIYKTETNSQISKPILWLP